jgi:cytochrome c peroxidase
LAVNVYSYNKKLNFSKLKKPFAMLNTCTFLRVALVCICAASFSSCDKEPEQLSLEKELALNKTNALSATSALSPKAQLGKQIFFDANLSESGDGSVLVMSCASCHMPSQGFSGFSDKPLGMIPRGFVAGFAEGAVKGKIGGRKPPSAAYATFSPILHLDSDPLEKPEFIGGLFWDGRATGKRLRSPAAEQALGPFLNPVEENLHDAKEVLERIKQDQYNIYGTLWQQVWGSPISTATQSDIDLNYDRVGLSIAAFEASNEVNKFSSKFDRYRKGQASLTSTEAKGFALFTGKGDCNRCHTEKSENGTPPLFTDFSYHNIGTPKNNSSAAPSSIDYGLGGFLQTLGPSHPWYKLAGENMGKFKTPTLRNVAKGGSNQRFMHNGAFRTLEEVVHFYNTRDEPGAGWAPPEVRMNLAVDSRLGRLRLTSSEEAAIVAFMKTLSDD